MHIFAQIVEAASYMGKDLGTNWGKQSLHLTFL